MAYRERSAGFIIFVDPDAEHSERLFLLLDYGRHWDFPKGHVEKGEDDLTAALRELAEETGITDAEPLAGFVPEIEYFFRHPKRGLIQKSVVFYLARTRMQIITLSHEHVGFAYLPREQALKRLTYQNAKEVLKNAVTFLDTMDAT